jgi:NADH dehydrogenase (ubiquinone) 1 beta subcomplex subunit 7
MKATHAEMREARVPIAMRDYCAHLLIPLNKCRQATMYLPWKCGHERHEYEKCEYVEHLLAQKRKVESS